jgi:hypothetical protein
MKLITHMSMVAAVALVLALLLAGCGGGNVPPFVTSDNLTRIEVTNDQNGQKGLASKEADNLNVLLNMLHLGDITASTRMDASEPTASAYTIVVHDSTGIVWSVRVLDAPQSSRVYLNDAVHLANNGIYPLKQPILIKDLDQFVQKNPAP